MESFTSLLSQNLLPSWNQIFRQNWNQLMVIESQIDRNNIFPLYSDIFRLFFNIELQDIRVVILGQDPYPGTDRWGNPFADGLAFSTRSKQFPSSLQNIFKELVEEYSHPLVKSSRPMDRYIEKYPFSKEEKLAPIQPTKKELPSLVLTQPMKKELPSLVLTQPMKKELPSLVLSQPTKKELPSLILTQPMKKELPSPKGSQQVPSIVEEEFFYPSSGELLPWVKQGVFLLNTALTVEKGKPGSHLLLWQNFTNHVIKSISEINPQVIFVLWGKKAQDKAKLLGKSFILESAHPSGLSANRGFFGNNHFRQINQILISRGEKPIIWQI